jgi:methionyl-tRNA formyltransferase
MRIVFFGTPEFAATILKALSEAKASVVAVVTRTDKPQGRSSTPVAPAVKKTAIESLPGIPLLQPQKCSTPEMVEELKKFQPDIFVVAAYGEILSQAILDIPRLGCINVHGSYLPKLRGAAPIQRALMQGDIETGISIIRMVRKMDAGNVLYAEVLPIGPNANYGELERALAHLGATCLLHTLKDLEQGKMTEIVQDEAQVTFADKITSKDLEIDWKLPAYQIHNQVRALSPEPSAFCYVTIREQKKRMKILQTELVDTSNSASFEVTCGKGSLRLLTVQLEGKPAMKASDFLKGTPRNQISIGI